MNDFAAFCPVVNRPDLLRNVIDAVMMTELRQNFTVIDNSENGWVDESVGADVAVYEPVIPMLFSQTMNFEMQQSWGMGKRFCVHMHSDAVIPPGAVEKLLSFVRALPPEKKWSVVYTNYDILAVYNPLAMKAFGGYDANFPSYFSDNDWYYRAELAGWERINTGIEVGHIGSQTINSDPYLRHTTAVLFPLHRQYYVAKWGGEPGCEVFKTPFGMEF